MFAVICELVRRLLGLLHPGWSVRVPGAAVLMFPLGISCAAELRIPSALGPAEFDSDVISAFLSSHEPGVLIGLLGSPELRASRLQLTYFPQPGKPIAAELLLANRSGHAVQFRLLCLLDYEQVPFSARGTDSLHHLISLPPDGVERLKLQIPGVERGAHDLILLVLQLPEGNENGQDLALYAYRVNLLAASMDMPDLSIYPITKTVVGEAMPHIVLNQRPDPDDFRVSKHVSDSSNANFAHVSSMRNSVTDYAVAVFSGGQQVKLGLGGLSAAFYRLNPNEVGVLPVEIPARDMSGDLWAVTIENPYALLETTPGEMASTPARVFVSNMVRLRPPLVSLSQ